MYEDPNLFVVEKEVTVENSGCPAGTFESGDNCVSLCPTAANLDDICVDSCPLDDNGIQLSVVNSETKKCECASGAIVQSRTLEDKTTEKYCGCAKGWFVGPDGASCVNECPTGYVVNVLSFGCVPETGSPCGAAGTIVSGACACDTNAGFSIVTEITELQGT